MVTTRPPKTIVKPTALDPVANTDTKLLIYGLFQKGRVLAQDEETDPNKLHDLKATLDGYQVYADAEIDQLVTLYLGGADRDRLDRVLCQNSALLK